MVKYNSNKTTKILLRDQKLLYEETFNVLNNKKAK